MKNIKKKIFILLMGLSIIFTLIGCGDIKIDSKTSINANGTSNTKVKVYYDDTISKLINNSLLEKVIMEIGDSLPNKIHFGEITKSKEGELNVEEISIDTDKIKINDLPSMSNDYINIQVNRDKGIFLDTYKVTLKLNDSLTNMISNYVNNNINNQIGLNLGDLIGKNVASIVSDVPIDVSISMPVKIIETNATEREGNKKIEYSYEVSDLNTDNNIMLSFNVPNIQNIIIISLVSILMVIILIVLIIRRKNKYN
ncbi:hypothetical protein ABFP60_13935 [Clostridioides difficile]